MLPGPRDMSSTTRLRRVAVGWVAVAAALTGCTADPGPDPGDTAQRLADALESGDLEGMPLTGAPGPQPGRAHARIVEGMAGLEPTVTVQDVAESDDEGSATATLAWSWPVAGEEWTYSTQAELTRGGEDEEWTAAWAPALVHPELEEGDVLDLTPVSARRGEVLGAEDEPLVAERPVFRFGIDRIRVPKREAGDSARALARLVGVDPGPYAARVVAAGDRAFVEAITYREGQVPPRVGSTYEQIRGALAVADRMSLAPTPDFARPILGSVGPVTAEMIKESPDRYEIGDEAGLSGLQARYDDQLRGTDGAVVDVITEGGVETEVFRVDARDGEPLRTTLDARLQLVAEDLLGGVGPASALVAVRPGDGAIVVAANGPGTDGYNVATWGQYAPGSTFKTASSLALLRQGLSPSSTVECPASVVVDGKRFGNYSDYPATALGPIPLRTAVAQSCNTAFVGSAGRLGDGDLAAAAASLGFGVDHDLGFPAYFGSVPEPASDVEAAADLIGQGTVLASPMSMATVIASVQAGEVVVPRLLEQVEVAVPDDVTPLSAREAGALRAMLGVVVAEGSGRQLADLPGPSVIAKTGTAEFERDGRVRTHAWMIAAQGDLAVAVFVEEGESGSTTAGPILEEFLRAAR